MQAAYITRYGKVEYLELRDLMRPTSRDGEIIVKIHAAPVTAADSMMRRGVPRYARLFLGLRRPRASVSGTGFAGTVVECGPGVTNFAPGDSVFGESGLNFGAHAEYVRLRADGVVLKKPDDLSFEAAAPLSDGALTVQNFLTRIADLQPGQDILIIGASGGLGTAAVQMASAIGANVTAVCSLANAAMVTRLGAVRTIDYHAADYANGRARYDVVFDVVGKSRFGRARKVLKPGGLYMSPVLSMGLLAAMLTTRWTGQRKATFSATGLLPADVLRKMLATVRDMATEGRLTTVIDRSYPLARIHDAYRYVDQGHKRGNVLVTPA